MVALVAVKIVTRNHQLYGWGIALAYFIFALSDLVGFFHVIGISITMFYLVKITATASMLWAVWILLKTSKSESVEEK